MSERRSIALGVLVAGVVLASAGAGRADVMFGQLDDFEGTSTFGWSEGGPSPNPPIVIATGGPTGADDGYLQNASGGGFGPGSRQIMFNGSRWIGNYSTAGVDRIEMKLANFGQTPLYMRLALSGAGSTRFGSTDSIQVPVGSGWISATFLLSAGALTPMDGEGSLAQLLAGVTEVRLLSAQAGPAFMGDGVAATLGVDNIRALRLPGDASFDGLVNFDDLLVLSQNYGTVGGATWAIGDFNFDGNVGFDDLLSLAQNYSGGSAALVNAPDDVGGTAFGHDWALARRSLIPEPTLALLPAGGLAVSACRRRRRGCL